MDPVQKCSLPRIATSINSWSKRLRVIRSVTPHRFANAHCLGSNAPISSKEIVFGTSILVVLKVINKLYWNCILLMVSFGSVCVSFCCYYTVQCYCPLYLCSIYFETINMGSVCNFNAPVSSICHFVKFSQFRMLSFSLCQYPIHFVWICMMHVTVSRVTPRP